MDKKMDRLVDYADLIEAVKEILFGPGYCAEHAETQNPDINLADLPADDMSPYDFVTDDDAKKINVQLSVAIKLCLAGEIFGDDDYFVACLNGGDAEQIYDAVKVIDTALVAATVILRARGLNWLAKMLKNYKVQYFDRYLAAKKQAAKEQVIKRIVDGVKQACKNQKITKEDLADISEVKFTTLSNILACNRDFSAFNLYRICKTLGISADDLLFPRPEDKFWLKAKTIKNAVNLCEG